MDPIDAALQDLREQTKPNISATSRKYSVDYTMLSRRYRGVQGSKAEKHENQGLLSKPQQRALIAYINKLSGLGLPPTPAMVTHFVFDIVKKHPGKGWCQRFCKKWSDHLMSRYLVPLDAARKRSESKREFDVWFELVKQKIEKYEILPGNMYNMDEKGFLIGFLKKSKRVFSKTAFESKKMLGNIQDGNREWITLVASICADGSALPPALIYKGSGNIQDSWVQDLELDKHLAFFSSSPTGWTNDHLGFEWLTKVFERHTKTKAGRKWRLLFIDGHGSHINMKFIDWALSHRILLAVYPPHSTHRLQPLDVSLFSPLSIYYSQELDQFLLQCQGLSSVTKRDFFRMFWPAYCKAFTPKNVASGWLKTGLYPLDPREVLQPAVQSQLQSHESSRPSTASSSSVLSASEWRKLRCMLRSVAVEVDTEEQHHKLQKLQRTIESITTDNALLKAENKGFREALYQEKKKRKRNKGLFEELRAEDGHGATFFSPAKIERAKALLEEREQAKIDKMNQKRAKAEATKVERQQKAIVRMEAAQQKKAHKETQQASWQLQSSLQASARKSRKPSRIVVLKLPSKVQLEEPVKLDALPHPVLLPLRTRRQPAYLAGYDLTG